MYPPRPCPRCSFPNQPANAFCAQCGAPLTDQAPPPQGGRPHGASNSVKTLLVVLGILFGSCMLCGIIGGLAEKFNPKPANTNVASVSATPAGVAATPSGTPAVSPAEHLSQAKKALADNYKPHKDPMKTTWGRVSDARRHLEAVPLDAKEHAEAQKLLGEVRKRESEIERLAKIGARRLVVEQMERKMLSEGHNFKFTISGPEKTVLTVKYVLMSRPLVYKLTNESDFLSNMREAGFKKVVFTDGYYESWTYDL